mmetsp:Transcript_46414/g.133668  ORF Transcript_46414/g.133668 Transcript_46414/m.133668 type:complete len:223 (+) Transcript_46414:435-1103(+)
MKNVISTLPSGVGTCPTPDNSWNTPSGKNCGESGTSTLPMPRPSCKNWHMHFNNCFRLKKSSCQTRSSRSTTTQHVPGNFVHILQGSGCNMYSTISATTSPGRCSDNSKAVLNASALATDGINLRNAFSLGRSQNKQDNRSHHSLSAMRPRSTHVSDNCFETPAMVAWMALLCAPPGGAVRNAPTGEAIAQTPSTKVATGPWPGNNSNNRGMDRCRRSTALA